MISPPTIEQTLRNRFGFDALRPAQQQSIDHLIAGRHPLTVLPTGSGKSLCYQLPALALREERGEGVTLVFSPLIALMEDQVSALRKRGIAASYINSTLTKNEREKRQDQLARGEFDILYATPERMTKPAFLDAIARTPGGVHLLAIDEAHCISKWGHDLRPAYRRVGEFRQTLGEPATIALTATATPAVKHDIREILGFTDEQMPLVETPLDRPNLSLAARSVWDDADKLGAIKEIAEKHQGTGIVYFALIKDLERTLSDIKAALPDRQVDIYHGQLDPKQKRRVYQRFINASPEDNLILLATNAFGMGVDKPDIRFIIHAQVPASVEAYYQEVGRAGRDAEPSTCLLLYSQDALAIQQNFVQWQNPPAGTLLTLAHHAEHTPHADFDAEELRLEALGKRTPSGMVEYAVIDLAKRGVIEPTSVMGRYRFAEPLDEHDIDEDEITEKTQRDLERLLAVVRMVQSEDIRSYVLDYFAG